MVSISVKGKVFDDPKKTTTKTGGLMVTFTIQVKTGKKKNKEDKFYITNFYKITMFLNEKMSWKINGLIKGSDVIVAGTDFYADAYEGKNGAAPALYLNATDVEVLTSSDAPTNVASSKNTANYTAAEPADDEAPF